MSNKSFPYTFKKAETVQSLVFYFEFKTENALSINTVALQLLRIVI